MAKFRDPASVMVSFTVDGLTSSEASALLTATPPLGRFVARVTQPALGPHRYRCDVDAVSLAGARRALDELIAHFDGLAPVERTET